MLIASLYYTTPKADALLHFSNLYRGAFYNPGEQKNLAKFFLMFTLVLSSYIVRISVK